jgi:signal transduction histidine kinase/ABC-type amino acid transport substrate-binding protein/CheY-like chemotaxis protein
MKVPRYGLDRHGDVFHYTGFNGNTIQNLAPLALIAIFLLTAFTGCSADSKNSTDINFIKTYLEIPGITEDEIAAIEAFKAEGRTFSYGSIKSTEAFRLQDGTNAGYSVLFCALMSELFGIPFSQKIYEWEVAKSELDSMALDFIGDLNATQERRQAYYMTHPIAERSLRIFFHENNDRFQTEEDINGQKLGFYGGSITAQAVINAYPALKFEIVDLLSTQEIAESLASGRIDAFAGDAVATVEFEDYPFISSRDFFSLIYAPVSMSTANPDLQSVISIVDKYIEAGGIDKLYELYREGRYEYAKYELGRSYTEAEAAYLAALTGSGAKVSVGLENDYYPVCFFNEKDNEFQGVVPDMLKEISLLTDIEFYTATEKDTPFYQILEMVNSGEVSFVSALLLTPERRDRYLWSERYYTSHYALISKINYPFLEMPQVVRARIGVNRGSAYEEMYKLWFPNNSNLVYYDTITEAMMAMDRDEVDMVMASENALITMTNYFEKPGYLINIQFNMLEEAYFGFNINEGLLSSIIRKSQNYIAIEKINKYWTSRVFDYSRKMMEAQRPWLIGAITLSLTVLVLIMALFFRYRNLGKRLRKIVADQTAIIKTESVKIKERAHWYEAILDAIPFPISVTGTDRKWTFVNKATNIFLGKRRKDILGKPCSNWGTDICNTADCGIECVQRGLKQTRFSHKGLSYKVDIETLQSLEGETTGFIEIVQDVTKLEQMAKQEAEAVSQAKSDFLASMSHEMRTPMNVVVGLTDLMLEEADVPVNIKEALEKINIAGNTLMELINDVLDISKIEAGKLELNPEEYDVPSLLNDIIGLNMIRIEDKPITFNLDINENLLCTLFGDDLRIKQILNNLLSNAFKYTKKGSVTLSTAIDGEDHRREDNNVWLSFTVNDTGIGIRKEDMAKLFTHYHQVDTYANRKIEGTGLGLSITKKLVELMGGEISVESEYGKGTIFHVRICQRYVSDKSIGKETAEKLRSLRYWDYKKGAQGKLVRQDLSYARVLVADDFSTNLDVAAGMLRKYKMKVDCVDNGQDAVDRIAAGDTVYNAVFMDHMMPGMDGIEAVRLIRTLGTEYVKNIPIIALTANAVAGSEQMFLNNGFNAFLFKPFNTMALDSIVQRWVRDKGREEGNEKK